MQEEWAEIKKHPEIGYSILRKSRRLHKISEIVLHHHERWDGNGYPGGLKQAEIPLGSRIIAVADSIDAMTFKRPYRDAMSWDACMEEIVKNCGVQFDPLVVKAVNNICDILKIQTII